MGEKLWNYHKMFLNKIIFRQINSLFCNLLSLVNVLISRNFCQICVLGFATTKTCFFSSFSFSMYFHLVNLMLAKPYDFTYNCVHHYDKDNGIRKRKNRNDSFLYVIDIIKDQKTLYIHTSNISVWIATTIAVMKIDFIQILSNHFYQFSV